MAQQTEASVWIDDTELQSLGVTVTLDSEEPMLPSFRTSTVTIPGRHGAYDFGGDMDVRNFALNCVFQRQSYTDLKAQIRDFVRLFLDGYGRPKTVKLRFGDEPDKYYNVKLGGGVPIERLANLGFFTLQLVAYDPFAYSPSNAYDPIGKHVYDDGYYYDSGIYYANTESFNWLYKTQYTGVHNYSFYNTGVRIKIKGRCENLKITHLETNTTMTIAGKFSNLDEILINTEDFSVSKNNGQNLLNETNGEFFRLVEGDNGFKFESETIPNATVTLEWEHRFV